MAKRFLNLLNCTILICCTPFLVRFDRWLWELGSATPLPDVGEAWLTIPTFLIFLVATLQQFYLMVSKNDLEGVPFRYVLLTCLAQGFWPICSYLIFAVLVKIVIVIFPSTLGWDPWVLFGIYMVWFAVTDPVIFKGAVAVIGVLLVVLYRLLR